MRLITKITNSQRNQTIYLEYNIWKLRHEGMLLHINDPRTDNVTAGIPFKLICTSLECADKLVNELIYHDAAVADGTQAVLIDENTFKTAMLIAKENQIQFTKNLGYDINQIELLLKCIEICKQYNT